MKSSPKRIVVQLCACVLDLLFVIHLGTVIVFLARITFVQCHAHTSSHRCSTK